MSHQPGNGKPVIISEQRLTSADFKQVKLAETIETRGDKSCRTFHSALWQADREKIRRMAPVEFIGRHMRRWFDYAICDEIHQLAEIQPRETRSALLLPAPTRLSD